MERATREVRMICTLRMIGWERIDMCTVVPYEYMSVGGVLNGLIYLILLRTQPPPLPPTASAALDSAGDPRQSAGPPMLSALGTPAGIWEIGLPLIVCSVVHW